jgi:hypothetical protein
MERVARIELANKPWQGFRLPLHHTRMFLFIQVTQLVRLNDSQTEFVLVDLVSLPLVQM